MPDDGTPDRFDEVRREWIARYAGNFPVQKRRAQVLNRRIRNRNRRLAGARSNPHFDNVIPHALARRATTLEGYLEAAVLAGTVLLAPIGWAAGIALYHWILGFIPHRLRSYPVPALLYASAALGTLTLLLYEPGTGLDSALIAPWLVAQIPATVLTAGVYGILNGWLAVDGAADWWPVPPQRVIEEIDYPMGPDDMTGPGIFYQYDIDLGEERTPIAPPAVGHRSGSASVIVAALAISGLGIVWTIAMVVMGVEGVINAAITGDMMLPPAHAGF